MIDRRQYRVPHTAWHATLRSLPDLGRVWEPFGHGSILRDLGVDVVSEEGGWREGEWAYDFCDAILVAHPDFAEYKDILTRLRESGKPWVTVLPDSKLSTLAFKDNFSSGGLCVLVPPGRIRFRKIDARGRLLAHVANIDVFFYAFGLKTPRNLVFMEESVPRTKRRDAEAATGSQ